MKGLVDSISFADASAIVDRHWREYHSEGVVGFGVADRNDCICFIVKVKDKDKATRSRLEEQYRGRDVEGLPVFVEIRNRVPLVEDVDESVVEADEAGCGPCDLLRAVVSRPGGFLILAGVAAAGVLLLLLLVS